MDKVMLAQGRTAEVYEWEGNKILKLYRKGMPKEAVENEYKIGLAVQKAGVPSPQVFDMITVEDRLGIIYEKAAGRTMIKMLITSPWNIAKVGCKMADIQHEFHRCIVENLSSQKKILRENILRAPMLSEEKKESILKYLDSLPENNKLCHGDFHPDNILISKNKVYIIDWMTGSMGCPAADVARTSILIRIGTMPPGTSEVVGKAVNFVRKKLYKVYIEHYLKLSGMTMEDIIAWEMPVAAARLTEWLPKEEKDKLMEIVDGYLEMYKLI